MKKVKIRLDITLFICYYDYSEKRESIEYFAKANGYIQRGEKIPEYLLKDFIKYSRRLRF